MHHPMFLPLLFSLLGLSLSRSVPEYSTCPGGYTNGEKIKEGSFVKLCKVSEHGYEINIIACLTPKGVEVPVGSKQEENRYVFLCKATAGGGAQIEMIPVGVVPSNGGQRENLKCDGKYSNGQKFKSGNFVKQCTSSPNEWSIDIVGCVSPSGKDIAIGGKIEEDGAVYSCVKTKEGAKIESEPVVPTGPKENLKCKDIYENGQKFNEGSFVKVCASTPYSYSISIAACLTPSGKEIAIGKQAEENRLIYSCVKTEKGAKIETDLATKGCEDGKYSKGETYTSANKRFLLKCIDEYGSNDIIACVTDEKKEIKVGSELVEGQIKHKCTKEANGSVRYQKEPIGGMNGKNEGCGQKYKKGQTILSKDEKFKFTCIGNDEVKFTACVVDGGDVKADTTKTVGVWTYECKSTPQGGATLSRKRVV